MTITNLQSTAKMYPALLMSFNAPLTALNSLFKMSESEGESEGEVTKTEEDKPLTPNDLPTIPRNKQRQIGEPQPEVTKTEEDRPGNLRIKP